jgi:hypothetical protein
MFCYASRTGTRRNLEALRRHGWGLLVSRAGVWRTEGFDHICGDNGAWADYNAGRTFDEEKYNRFLDWLGLQSNCLDWIVLPDIVAGGLSSLNLSIRYLNLCLSIAPMVLLSVQDGMEASDVASLVGPTVGIFLGGSTEWKLNRMRYWGEFCATRGIYYHVARVNTIRRVRLAISSGANSIDGSSGSRYAVNIPKLSYASKQSDFFSPIWDRDA